MILFLALWIIDLKEDMKEVFDNHIRDFDRLDKEKAALEKKLAESDRAKKFGIPDR